MTDDEGGSDDGGIGNDDALPDAVGLVVERAPAQRDGEFGGANSGPA